MKTQFSTALVILAVLVTVSVNGTPPVANSATSTTKRTAGAFIQSPVEGGLNPGPVPAPASPLRSNAVPGKLQRSLQEREMARIHQLARDGGLGPAPPSERRFEYQMSPAQSFQPDVSFSGDQINILKTFLK